MTTVVIVPESGVFQNADGLRVKYGLAENLKGVGGTVALKDDTRKLYYDIDWTRLPKHAAAATGNLYGSEPEDALPTGAVIISATLIVGTAFSTGSSPTLTLGFVDRSGQETGGGDYDGLFATEAAATMTTSAVVASTGAQVAAAPTTAPLYLFAGVGTADFTAGNARLEVDYYMPRSV